MFENHMETKEKRGWYRCGTCQIDSGAKVSNGVIKVGNEWCSCREYENSGVNAKEKDENIASRIK